MRLVRPAACGPALRYPGRVAQLRLRSLGYTAWLTQRGLRSIDRPGMTYATACRLILGTCGIGNRV